MADKEMYRVVAHIILLFSTFQVCLGGFNLQEVLRATYRHHRNCSHDPDICRNVVSLF